MKVNWYKQKNRIIKEPVHIIDIMPTCLDVSGIKYPKVYKGNQIIPKDGQSFASAFQNKSLSPKRELFWEHEGNKAFRLNDWKLVKLHKKPWELYNLKDDPTELNNLFKQKTLKADSIDSIWNNTAGEIGVREWPVK